METLVFSFPQCFFRMRERIMPRRLKRGRPRKSGVPTRGNSGALHRRYYRARRKLLDGVKIDRQEKHDLLSYYKYAYNHTHWKVRALIPNVKKVVEQAFGREIMEKELKPKKAKKSPAQLKKAAEKKLLKEYTQIIEALQAGNVSSDFTLVHTTKVETNHTVEPIVVVDGDYTLCQFKK